MSLKIKSVSSKITMPLLATATLLFLSCQQQPGKESNDKMRAFRKTDTARPAFTRDMVDNLRDPSCGMPLTAAVQDTLYYGGKVYGFCSDECRDEFKKNPAELARNASMKK